jgi:hypothetical protein
VGVGNGDGRRHRSRAVVEVEADFGVVAGRFGRRTQGWVVVDGRGGREERGGTGRSRLGGEERRGSVIGGSSGRSTGRAWVSVVVLVEMRAGVAREVIAGSPSVRCELQMKDESENKRANRADRERAEAAEGRATVAAGDATPAMLPYKSTGESDASAYIERLASRKPKGVYLQYSRSTLQTPPPNSSPSPVSTCSSPSPAPADPPASSSDAASPSPRSSSPSSGSTSPPHPDSR